MSAQRRAWLVVGLIGLFLGLGALAVWLGIAMTGQTSPAEPAAESTATPADDPTPRPVPSDTAAASPTTVPEVEPERPAVPADCASLYSASMTAELESYGVVLNPAWTLDDPNSGLSFADPELEQWSTELPSLTCLWTTPGGGSGIGLETQVVAVLPDEGTQIEARLDELGYASVDELGGTRYLWSVEDEEFGGAFGESHIVVGDYWFATAWVDLGVTGYTADMVQNLVGVE